MTLFVGHLGTRFGEGKMVFETTRLNFLSQKHVGHEKTLLESSRERAIEIPIYGFNIGK
jgi:hypothetical protein